MQAAFWRLVNQVTLSSVTANLQHESNALLFKAEQTDMLNTVGNKIV